jgi:two-component system nitrate/nitrite response regulator NarL
VPNAATCVYLADDHPLFLEAIVAAVRERPELELVGVAMNGSDAAAGINALEPDVAVLDMRMPLMSGQEVLEATSANGTRTRFLFLSGHIEEELVYRALAGGASGYVSKDVDREALCDAMVAVARGEVVLSADVKESLASAIQERDFPERPLLTPRERVVLVLAAEGSSTREIAVRLGVAAPTVKTHLQSIFHKLAVSDRTSAVAAALRRGLLE